MLFAVFASNLCAIFALLTEHIFRKLNRNDLAFSLLTFWFLNVKRNISSYGNGFTLFYLLKFDIIWLRLWHEKE